MAKVTVIDALMGSGKTTTAFKYINDHPEYSFVYCTPLLSEINRIQKECPEMNMLDPKRIDGRKINGFNWLLEQGKNIAVTHTTFSNSDVTTIENIKANKYILILDEVLDILVNFNDIASKKIRSGDPKLMLDNGLISVDKYGKVSWIAKDCEDSSFSDVKALADKGSLFYLDNSFLVWQFPPAVFDAFEKTFILTYLFDGSFLKPYFQYHGIKYDLRTIDNGIIVPYHPTTEEQLAKIRELITIDFSPKRNNYKGFSLSKNYYLKASRADKAALKKNIYNYLRNVAKASARDIMWTAYDDVMIDRKENRIKSALSGPGYVSRPITEEEEKAVLGDELLTADEKQKRLANMKSCYVPNNVRATNDYRDRSVLVYALNLYCNRYSERFFSNKNETDGLNIHIDEDAFSLSCLLQWIWRSQIRDGKPIMIYIPSTRMRNLLVQWLNNADFCDAAA